MKNLKLENLKEIDEYEPFQELLVKELFHNESNNLIFNSWELVNSSVVLKTLDKSAYLYRMTGVPMGIRSFFDESLGRNDSKEIRFIYNEKEYYDLFNDDKDKEGILLPKIKFEKQKEDNYIIDFII